MRFLLMMPPPFITSSYSYFGTIYVILKLSSCFSISIQKKVIWRTTASVGAAAAAVVVHVDIIPFGDCWNKKKIWFEFEIFDWHFGLCHKKHWKLIFHPYTLESGRFCISPANEYIRADCAPVSSTDHDEYHYLSLTYSVQ